MIALDTNVIVYLLVSSQKEHKRARRWFDAVESPLVTTGTNIGEVLRLLTHPRVFPVPLALDTAVDLLDGLIRGFQVGVLEEADEWWLDLKDLLDLVPSLKGNEVFDARIALCLRYNGVREICTLDANFSKYSFLKVIAL